MGDTLSLPPCTPARSNTDAKATALAQRAACDRCRGQKLRCPRTKPGSQIICDRCQRIGAVCHTAPRLPSGRPSLRTADISKRKSRNQRNSKSYIIPQTPPSKLNNLPSPSTTTTHSPDLGSDVVENDLFLADQISPSSLDHDALFPYNELFGDTFDSTTCCDLDIHGSSPTFVFDPKHSPLDVNCTTFPTADSLPLAWADSGVSQCSPSTSTQYSDISSDSISTAPSKTFIDRISSISIRFTEIQDSGWLNQWDALYGYQEANDTKECRTMKCNNDERFTEALTTLNELYRLSHRYFTRPDMDGSEDSQRLATHLSTTLILLSAYVQAEQFMCKIMARVMASYHDFKSSFNTNGHDHTQILPWEQDILFKIQVLESHCHSIENLLQQSCDADNRGTIDTTQRWVFNSTFWSPLARTMAIQVLVTLGQLKREIALDKLVVLGLTFRV